MLVFSQEFGLDNQLTSDGKIWRKFVGFLVQILRDLPLLDKEQGISLKQLYWGTDGIWSEGYCVSTVGIHEAVIRQYIENQGKEDAGQAKLELG